MTYPWQRAVIWELPRFSHKRNASPNTMAESQPAKWVVSCRQHYLLVSVQRLPRLMGLGGAVPMPDREVWRPKMGENASVLVK